MAFTRNECTLDKKKLGRTTKLCGGYAGASWDGNVGSRYIDFNLGSSSVETDPSHTTHI